MNEQPSARKVLLAARSELARRLSELVLAAEEEVLADARGESYMNEIETLYEQVGIKLAHVNQMLAGLPADLEVEIATPAPTPSPSPASPPKPAAHTDDELRLCPSASPPAPSPAASPAPAASPPESARIASHAPLSTWDTTEIDT